MWPVLVPDSYQKGSMPMLNWLLSKWSWKSFAFGFGAALFGGTIARPALVEAVKTGMDVRDRLDETLQGARREVDSIRSDAEKLRAASPPQAQLTVELQKLRDEIASLKTAFGHVAQKSS